MKESNLYEVFESDSEEEEFEDEYEKKDELENGQEEVIYKTMIYDIFGKTII